MKALVWHGGPELAVEERPDPEPSAADVVLDVSLAGICGSDLGAYRGHGGPRRPPLVLGHEVVGTVPGLAGRYVVFPFAVCGRCPACRRGEEQLCERRQMIGMHRDGVFAERAAVPRDGLIQVPEQVGDAHAVLVEPLAVCVSALRGRPLSDATRLLVLGCGPIGLLTIHAAAASGAAVVAVDPVEERRAIARRWGAATVLGDVAEVVPEAADLAVDAVGMHATWTAAIRGLRAGGELVLLGLGQADGPMPVADLVRRSITVSGHFAYTRDDFATALALLAERPPRDGWVDVMPLSAGKQAFAALTDSPPRNAKILLEVG